MRSGVITVFTVLLSFILSSCATYQALPHSNNNESITNGDTITCNPTASGQTLYCRTDDGLLLVSITPYQAVRCQTIEFVAQCGGSSNSGVVSWNFGDNVDAYYKKLDKTYARDGVYPVTVVCNKVDGINRVANLKVFIGSNTNGNNYTNFQEYYFSNSVTDVTPGDTSCPRIELK